MWNDQFKIEAQTDTSKPMIEIAKGSRIAIFGEGGAFPTMITGVGHYYFDKSSTSSVEIQGIKTVVLPNGKNPLLDKAVTDHLGGVPATYTNEQLVIATLLRMLGGVVTITEDEMKTVNKTTKLSAIRSDEIFGGSEPRLVLKLEEL